MLYLFKYSFFGKCFFFKTKNRGRIMEYMELTIEDVKKLSLDLAKKIKKDFNPDYVLFVERGSLYIGQEVSNFFEVPLLGVSASRKKSKLKKVVSPLLIIIPSFIKKKLREKEINSNTHEKNSDRKVFLNFDCNLNKKNVVIVDDSADTGFSILQIQKTACLNVLDKSVKNIKIDYFLMKNTMLSGPWSNDSKFHKQFLIDFQHYKSGGFFCEKY